MTIKEYLTQGSVSEMRGFKKFFHKPMRSCMQVVGYVLLVTDDAC